MGKMIKKLNLFFILLLVLFLVVGCGQENIKDKDEEKPEEKIEEKKEEPVKVPYTVTVNVNEDGEDSSIYVYKLYDGQKVIIPEIPQVDHHECVGFYNGDTLWDFENDVVHSDLELVGKWIETITAYEAVMDTISKIDVNDYSTIKEAREQYEALSETNKSYVTNYRNLYNAEIDYFNTCLKNASTLDDLNELFVLLDSYPEDTLYKIGTAAKSIYNKRFELTYADKISEANIHQQEVVKAVANAFLYKGVYNQYDQTRRVAGSSPYDASKYDTLYLDCSAFCYSVYTYIFGSTHNVNLNTASNDSYARSHQDSAEIVYYIETKNYKTEAEQKALLQEIYDNLQVGDLINYRHGVSSGNKGHVVMYIGNGTIIHSTGDDMSASEYSSNPELFKEVQSTTEASIGTVFTFDAAQLFFDTTCYRYLFKSNANDTVYQFAVIRPLAKQMTISDKGLSNYLLADVDITKTSSVGARTSVHKGDEIVYTVTLKNYGDQDIENIPIYKEVTRYFDFVSCSDDGLYIENVGVMHSIDLKANETKDITYTFRVKDDDTISGTINDGATYIHNISLPKISNSVVYEADMEKFISNAIEMVNTKTFATTYDFINEAYKVIREEGISDIFPDENKETAFITSTGYNVPDVIKGTTVKRVLNKYLCYGDILTYYNQKTKEYTTYLYVKEDLMVCIKNGNYANIVTRSSVQLILDKMFAMSKYQLIRPLTIK